MAELSETKTVVYAALRSGPDVANTVYVPAYGFYAAAAAQIGFQWVGLWGGSHRPRVASIKAAVLKDTLDRFQAILQSAGCSIVYLNPYTEYTDKDSSSMFVPAWAVVGFAGTFGDLASIPTRTFSFDSRNWTTSDVQALLGLTSNDVVLAPAPNITPAEGVDDYATFEGNITVLSMPPQ
jgi:hypothetical protein